MFKQFALCLCPALLAYLLTLIMVNVEGSGGWVSEAAFGFIMFLIVAGAVISGICVGKKVLRRAKGEEGIRWLLAILTFLGVVIAYLGIGFAGCCGVAAFGEYMSYR